MIRLVDAVRLAHTKIKAHRVRTAITVIICALLFSGLLFLLIAVEGVKDPVQKYGDYTGIDRSSPIAKKAVKEYKKDQKQYTSKDAIALAKQYNAKDTYELDLRTVDGSIDVMKDGKELFEEKTEPNDNFDQRKTPLLNDGVTVVPETVVSSYEINSSTWKPEGGRIPLLVPQYRAEQIVGISAPKKGTSTKERLDYATALRTKVVDKVVVACYRNAASSQQISDAISTARDIEKHKNDKNYQKPSLVYGLPADDSCAAATVVCDVRTAQEKKLEQKTNEFHAKFSEG